MADKKPNDSRRKLLKSIAAGSGAVVAGKSLPESWSKPVVNSVLLPAHAETTTGSGPIPAPCCDIDGTYCGIFGDGASIEITVESSGVLTIVLQNGENTIDSSVDCDGGSFNTAEDNPDALPGATVVTGTVVCNRGPIVGKVIISGSQFQYDYTASIDVCPA